MIKRLLSFLIFATFFIGNSQNVQLSVYAEISIVTSGPGENIYEKFGHTAIRVKDPVLKLDILYNYGIFDFEDPNFIPNFVKGYMKYQLASYSFHYALKSANEDERWTKQQVLNLTQKEKNAFFYFLEQNAAPENAKYFYDPFFDNCATRPKDIIKKIIGEQLELKGNFITEDKSLRDLMNEKIHPNTWGSFGINIALGNRLDKTATLEEYAYLPEYLFEIVADSKIKRDTKVIPLAKKTEDLITHDSKLSKGDIFSPFLIFSLLLIITLIVTYRDLKNNKRTKGLDFLLFISTGFLGILIVFLSFFTNHSTAPNNFNFLWGFAPNVVIAFLLLKKKLQPWLKKYVFVLLILMLLIPIIWISGIQKFTYPIIPLLITLTIRYFYLLIIRNFE